jgi:hypothetical protein
MVNELQRHGRFRPKGVAMPDGTIVAPSAAEQFFNRMPVEIADGLTAEQKSAIAAAFIGGARPPVNLRLSIPLLGWRFFFAVMAGHDRRGAERRAVERARHPVHTAGNFLFVIAGSMAFYLIALAIFLVWSSVIEP